MMKIIRIKAKRISIVLIVSVVLWIVPTPLVVADEDNLQLIQSLNIYYQAYPVIKKMREDIKEAPHYYLNYLMLAMAYEKLGMYYRKAQVLEDALKKCRITDDMRISFYNQIAQSYILMGKVHKAKRYIDSALALKKEDISTLETLFHYYIAKEQFKKAAKVLTNIANRQKGKDIYEPTVYLLLKQYTPETVKTIFKEIMALEGKNPKVYNALGLAEWEGDKKANKRWKEIKLLFKKAIDLDPSFLPAYYNLIRGDIFWMVTNQSYEYLDEIMQLTKKALSFKDDEWKFLTLMAYFWFSKEDYDKALKYGKKAFEKGNGNAITGETLGLIYTQKAEESLKKGKDLQKALDWLDKALALRDDPYIFSVKAQVLLKMKHYPEAYEAIKKALREDPYDQEYLDILKEIKKNFHGEMKKIK